MFAYKRKKIVQFMSFLCLKNSGKVVNENREKPLIFWIEKVLLYFEIAPSFALLFHFVGSLSCSTG